VRAVPDSGRDRTLTYLGSESGADEYLLATGWLPLIGLSLVLGWIPDLLAWRMARTSPFRHGVAGRGLSTAVCVLPKQLFPLEDHVAIRELIRDKVGSLRPR
jgi:hypothetical protein